MLVWFSMIAFSIISHRSPCPLILKIWCLLGNSHCLLLLVLWLITLWRVWNPRGSEAREILQKGHFYFLLSLTHSFSTTLCILVCRAWTIGAFVFVLHAVLFVPACIRDWRDSRYHLSIMTGISTLLNILRPKTLGIAFVQVFPG